MGRSLAVWNHTHQLLFFFKQAVLTLTADAQILPQNSDVNIFFLVLVDIGHPSGSGLDFIFGMVAIQRFYVVLDTGNSEVGFAQTSSTNAIINFLGSG
jgi:cathepsin E